MKIKCPHCNKKIDKNPVRFLEGKIKIELTREELARVIGTLSVTARLHADYRLEELSNKIYEQI